MRNAPTQTGGTYNKGTVFSITTAGAERVLHSFGFKKDGQNPVAGLVVLNGLLYGTASYGGTKNKGVVFTITKAGAEKGCSITSAASRRTARSPARV